MPNTKKENLVEILQSLRKIGDILGSSIISTDGLSVASDLGEGIDDETFAAMSCPYNKSDSTSKTLDHFLSPYHG